MPIGPVQLVVLGFSEPKFRGEILAELDRLKESDVVRRVEAAGDPHRRGVRGEEEADPGHVAIHVRPRRFVVALSVSG
jgi:hypothetical protein